MKIKINNSTTVNDVQQQFQKAYPYLKIEFADKSHEFGETTKTKHWYDKSFKLSAISKKLNADTIGVQGWKKTGDVEEEFKTKFLLFPQIYRREGSQWIQTAGTDVFTLDEQNEIGKKSMENPSDNLWIEREKIL